MKVGIIGYGRIGAEHARWMRDAGFEPPAVADATPARRALAEKAGLHAVERAEALFDDPSISAILVAVPTAMHFDLSMQALSAGKHVMVEKPMALDLPQSQKMVEEAERRKLVLSVFQNRRWDIDFLTVKKAIDDGVFGKVFNVESRLGQWSSCVGPAAKEYRPNWRNEAAFGGGALYDWGSHFIDQMRLLMLPAKPTRVSAQLRGNVWSKDCDDFARVMVDFDNGAVGLVEMNTTTTRPLPRWHIDGEKGSAFSPYSLEFDTDVWASLRFTNTDQDKHVTLPKATAGLSESDIWRQFASACSGNGQPAVSARSVLPTIALLDAARSGHFSAIDFD